MKDRNPLMLTIGIVAVLMASYFAFAQTGAKAAKIKLDDAIAGYSSWTKVTKDRYSMSARMMVLCRMITKEEQKMLEESPHAKGLIDVYANDIGKNAIKSEVTPRYPVGTIIVKVKYDSVKSNTPSLITAMRKLGKGHGDNAGGWEFLAIDPKTMKAPEQEVKHCVSCHNKVATADYVFRPYVTNAIPY